MTLGSCMLSADVPFSGMALDIFNRRVQGVSWKDIADEFDLGTPGKARKVFTKMTGITDYQIKGPDLLKLAQGGLDQKLTAPKIKKAKKVLDPPIPEPTDAMKLKWAEEFDDLDIMWDEMVQDGDFTGSFDKWLLDNNLTPKEIEIVKGLHPFANIKPGEFHQIFDKLEDLMDMPDDLAKYMDDIKKAASKVKNVDIKAVPDLDILKKYDDVIEMHKNGSGYQAIVNKTGRSFKEVDEAVWNYSLKVTDGDVWKAYKMKPTSETGFNAVQDMVFKMRKAGMTIDEVVDASGVDKAVVKAITEKKWKLPSPGSTTYYKPLDVQMPTPSSISGTSGHLHDIDNFPILDANDMKKNLYNSNLTGSQTDALKSYTGAGYQRINGKLRGLSSGQVDDLIRQIDSSMIESKISFSVTRGMSREGFGMGYLSDADIQNLAGVVFADPGYMSTSIKPIFGSGVRLVIECPPGTKGIWVKPISRFSGEDEFLLARGTRMMVKKVVKEGYNWKVVVQVIP